MATEEREINAIEQKERAIIEQKKREDKDQEKNELLRELSILSSKLKHDWRLYRVHGSWLQPQEEEIYTRFDIIKADLSKGVMLKLHEHKLLPLYIEELKSEGKLENIPKILIEDLLVIGGYKPVEKNAASSAISLGRSQHTLHKPSEPMSNSTKVGIGLGAVSFTALTGITLAALLTKTTVAAAATAFAVATTATAAFPPVAIALLIVGGSALLITGIVLAAIAIQHARQMKAIGKEIESAAIVHQAFGLGR